MAWSKNNVVFSVRSCSYLGLQCIHIFSGFYILRGGNSSNGKYNKVVNRAIAAMFH